MSQEPKLDATVSVRSEDIKRSRVQIHEWSLEVTAGPDKGKKVTTLGDLLRVGSDAANDPMRFSRAIYLLALTLSRMG